MRHGHLPLCGLICGVLACEGFLLLQLNVCLDILVTGDSSR